MVVVELKVCESSMASYMFEHLEHIVVSTTQRESLELLEEYAVGEHR
jgi:hypothetical protein